METTKDHWILDDMVNVIGGRGYGLNDNLETFYIGTEQEINEALEGKEGIDYDRIRRNLDRAGVDREVATDKEPDARLQNERTTRPARVTKRPSVQRGRGGSVAPIVPRSTRKDKKS